MTDWASSPEYKPPTPDPVAGSWNAAPLAGPTPQQKAVVSAIDNSDEAAKAVGIAKRTGIPAPIIASDIPSYDAFERTQAAVKAVNNPAIAAYVDGNPMAAKVSADDYDKLDEVSQYIKNLQQDKIKGQAHVGLFQGIPEMVDLLGSAPGRDKLWNALKQLPGALAEGMLDFVKTPGKVASGGIDPNTPEGLDAEIGFGIGVALGTGGKIKTGRAPIPKGTVSVDEFLSTLRGMKTREEIDAFLRNKAEGEGPPGTQLQIEHAKAASESLDAAVEAAQESKTKIRSPDIFEEFAAAHGDSNLHIDANKIIELYQKEGKVPAEGDGLLGFIPDLARQAQVAAETGGEVTVPLSKYLAHVDPAVHEGLKDSVRLHDDGVTLTEAEEVQKSIEAYHGSPHDFDTFSLKKIGTGEGAQSYGHGLYFAEHSDVAKTYAQTAETTVGGQVFDLNNPVHQAADFVSSYKTREAAIKKLEELVKKDPVDEVQNRTLDYLKSGRPIPEIKYEGNQYKVRIHANKEDFLDWDKPLNEQSPKVQEVFKKLLPDVDQSEFLTSSGERLYNELSSGDRQSASKMLHEAGIPGIKYLDQGSRPKDLIYLSDRIAKLEILLDKLKTQAPEGANKNPATLAWAIAQLEKDINEDKAALTNTAKPTHNLVIFSDKDVEITHRNGEALQKAAAEVVKSKQDLFLNQLFQDAKSVGLTEPEFKKYSDKIEAANAAMIQKSIERDVARRTAPEWKKNEAAIKAEVEEQFSTTGRYAAQKFIDENKITLTPENADQIAPMFGYGTGAALSSALKDVPSFADAVKAEVAARMETQFGDRRANIQQEARELALSDDWHGILADEVRILADAAGVKPALGQREMTQWAKDSFEVSNIVDAANWEKLRRAVEKGGKEAEKALLKGDVFEAFKAKQRQMLAAVLAKESIKLQKEIDSAEKKIDRFSSNEVIKSIDQAHLEQIRQMFASVGLPQQFAPLEGTPPLRDFVANAEGQIAAAPWLMDGTQPKLKDMTVDQFRAFANTMKSLEHVGRLAKTVENAQKKAELDNVVFDIKKELERFPFIDQPLNPSYPQRIAGAGRRIIGAHLLVERMLDYTDKFNPHGPITEFLDRPLRDSNSKEIVLTEQVTKMLRDLKQHTDSSINELIDNQVIPDALAKPVYPANTGYLQMSRANLRQLMLNMGNETNIKKATEGFNIPEGQLMELIDKNATLADWKWVQGVWDIFAHLKPEADAMQLRDTGVPVDSKVPRKITNAHGEFAGGYYPIVYDRYNSDIQGTMVAKNPIFAPTYVSATTPHGYTEAVTGYKGALDLTGGFLATRLQGMIHDIAFREAIRNANKLISNQELRTAIAQRWGKENAELLPGWLKDIANSHTLDDNYAQGIVRAMAIVRQNTISTLIAFNPGTFIKHGFTAALLSAGQVGVGPLASAAKDIGISGAAKTAKDIIIRNKTVPDEAFMDAFRDALDQGERGENARQFVLDSSPVMRNRQRQYEDSIRGAVDAMNKAGIGKMLADTRQQAMLYGRMAVAFSDAMSAMPTWLAAYKKAYLGGENHANAVFIADKEVSRAHGSSFVGDQPLVTRLPNTMNGEVMRWFVPLYKFWNHVTNNNFQLAWDAAAKARGQGEGPGGAGPEPGANAASITKRVGIALATIFIEEQATAPLTEDKKGFLHSMVMASIRYLGGGFVGLREVTNPLAGGYEPSVGLLGTVMKAGAQTARDIGKSTSAGAAVSKDWLIHTATAIGILTGVGGTQVGKTGSFMKDLATGREQPQSFNAYRQGVRTGHSQGRRH